MTSANSTTWRRVSRNSVDIISTTAFFVRLWSIISVTLMLLLMWRCESCRENGWSSLMALSRYDPTKRRWRLICLGVLTSISLIRDREVLSAHWSHIDWTWWANATRGTAIIIIFNSPAYRRSKSWSSSCDGPAQALPEEYLKRNGSRSNPNHPHEYFPSSRSHPSNQTKMAG